MKDGVYINLNNDVGNLLVVVEGKLIDGEAVALADYSVDISFDGKKLTLTFSKLEYLGKL